MLPFCDLMHKPHNPKSNCDELKTMSSCAVVDLGFIKEDSTI